MKLVVLRFFDKGPAWKYAVFRQSTIPYKHHQTIKSCQKHIHNNPKEQFIAHTLPNIPWTKTGPNIFEYSQKPCTVLTFRKLSNLSCNEVLQRIFLHVMDYHLAVRRWCTLINSIILHYHCQVHSELAVQVLKLFWKVATTLALIWILLWKEFLTQHVDF